MKMKNFEILKATKATKTHPVTDDKDVNDTKATKVSSGLGFDISCVYEDNDSSPKGGKFKFLNGNEKTDSKVYINDVHSASASYSVDMGFIHKLNPSYIRNKMFKK